MEMVGDRMGDIYKVKALINFTDYLGKDINNPSNEHYDRKAGESEWLCDAERYKYLKNANAVELIEIIKVEEPVIEEKPKKKKAKK